jgi:hypothetical protein
VCERWTEIFTLEPTGEGFGEVVIAVAGDEAAIAYTEWIDDHNVAVRFLRIAFDGTPKGASILLRAYHVGSGQIANPDFYGALSMATDGSRYMLCWGDYPPVRCATVSLATGEVAQSEIASAPSGIHRPHVAYGPSGWFLFHGNATAIALGNDARPMGMSITVPATLAVGTASGYAVAGGETGQVYRLGPDLKTTAGPIELGGQTAPRISAIAAMGDTLSVGGDASETRIDASNRVTKTPLGAFSLTVVASGMDGVGVAGSSWEGVAQYRYVDNGGNVVSAKNVGCAPRDRALSIAAAGNGFLIASLDPDSPRQVFYSQAYRGLRVVRVPP